MNKNELKSRLAFSFVANCILTTAILLLSLVSLESKNYFKEQLSIMRIENERITGMFLWELEDATRCMSAITRAESTLGIDLSVYFPDNTSNKANKVNQEPITEIPNE